MSFRTSETIGIDWTPPPHPRPPWLSFPHTDGYTIPKKNPGPTGGANWLRFTKKNIKNACWCMYLPKGEYSKCRSGAHQVPQVCQQVCNKTHPDTIYDDVEIVVQFTPISTPELIGFTRQKNQAPFKMRWINYSKRIIGCCSVHCCLQYDYNKIWSNDNRITFAWCLIVGQVLNREQLRRQK